MELLLLLVLSIPFVYLNAKIILKDIKEKVIPNKLLLFLLALLPLFYLSLFYFNDIDINFLSFSLQIIFSIGICFLLYYFWIWWAWDAKYLLVLYFYISIFWILKFIWNISIIIIIYSLLYFLYFYIWKSLIDSKYWISLYKSIFVDLKDKFILFIKHSDWNIYRSTSIKIILNWIILFLFIFVSFRLTRLYFMGSIIEKNTTNNILVTSFQSYLPQIFVLIFLIFYFIRFILNRFILFIYHWFEDKYWIIIKFDKTKLLIPLILIFSLTSFIIYEYFINPYEIQKYLHRIFTLYISLYILIRIILYSYILTFHTAETIFLDIDKLEKWEIVDKKYLITLFWEQSCLWKKNEEWILFPSPKLYFSKIHNPIDTETSLKLKEIYKIVDMYHIDNKTQNYGKVTTIKTFKTFSFSPYIFLWFLLTLIFQDKIFRYLYFWLLKFVQNILSWNT